MTLNNVFLLTILLLYWAATSDCKRYTPDWESLDSRPLPTWYDEDKIGIFMHFGPYSVPGFRSEWFWTNWEKGEEDVVQFMADNYQPKFTYQDFGPQLTMEFFNASWFSDLVTDSGAKYMVFTSKHHDGFANWNSTYAFSWNSVDVGARRNVLVELKNAFDERHPNFHFGIYYSLFEWFNPIYLKDKATGFKSRTYPMQKMLPEMKELAELIQPHVWWSDGDWETGPDYFGSREFMAWLYNDCPSKDFVVTNDRWGIGTTMKHGSFYSGPDRWQPGQLIPHKWESAITVDRQSWGIRRNINLEEILSPEDLVRQVVVTVSCGGNILVNVGPTKEGTIIPIFEERLRQMGQWLSVNGEAIYGTKPWTHQNDSSTQLPDVWYTEKENNVYAMMLGWPSDDILILNSVMATESSVIKLVGYSSTNLVFTQQAGSLQITLPPLSKVMSACPKCKWAFSLKMTNVKPVNYIDEMVVVLSTN